MIQCEASKAAERLLKINMQQVTGIGILIRNRRKELGMNQAELSKRSTLSQAHVSRCSVMLK